MKKNFYHWFPIGNVSFFPLATLKIFFLAFQLPDDHMSRYGILCVSLSCDLLSFLYLWVYASQQI